LVAITMNPFGGSTPIPSFTGTKCANAPCGLWLQVEVESEEVAVALDKKIDGVESRTTGKLRIRNKEVQPTLPVAVFFLLRAFEE